MCGERRMVLGLRVGVSIDGTGVVARVSPLVFGVSFSLILALDLGVIWEA